MCVGKRIHENLITATSNDSITVLDIVDKYVQECQLLSELHHSNITTFFGICFLPDYQFPILVMEKLDGSLDDLLETIPGIPLSLKCSILEDVARGLLYLHKHKPQLVHRDLTAKNVLLTTSLEAKISDFGNSHIVNVQPDISSSSTSLVYRSPDSLYKISSCTSVDIFSFGHLIIFTLTQVYAAYNYYYTIDNNIANRPSVLALNLHLMLSSFFTSGISW